MKNSQTRRLLAATTAIAASGAAGGAYVYQQMVDPVIDSLQEQNAVLRSRIEQEEEFSEFLIEHYFYGDEDSPSSSTIPPRPSTETK